MTNEPTTRQQAIEDGLPYYKTGKACRNGHISKRSTLTGQCHECLMAIQKRGRKRLQAKIAHNRK